MLIIGLTGSIGMGKSETARMFGRLGIPVYDADAAVHALYGKGGGAVEPIGRAFPGVVRDGAIDRAALSAKVLGHPEELARLETIIHPLVGEVQRAWLVEQDRAGARMVVLDIPLLLETGGRDRVDVVVVTSAPEDVQRARVLERPGMSAAKLEAILKKQMSDAEKRRQADFIIDTSQGLDHAFAAVRQVVEALKDRPGRIWPEAAKDGR